MSMVLDLGFLGWNGIGDETSEYATVRIYNCRLSHSETANEPRLCPKCAIMLESVPIMLDISKALLCPTFMPA